MQRGVRGSAADALDEERVADPIRRQAAETASRLRYVRRHRSRRAERATNTRSKSSATSLPVSPTSTPFGDGRLVRRLGGRRSENGFQRRKTWPRPRHPSAAVLRRVLRDPGRRRRRVARVVARRAAVVRRSRAGSKKPGGQTRPRDARAFEGLRNGQTTVEGVTGAMSSGAQTVSTGAQNAAQGVAGFVQKGEDASDRRWCCDRRGRRIGRSRGAQQRSLSPSQGAWGADAER